MNQLPGGLWKDGARQREYAFKPVTGALELAVAEISENAANMPDAVDQALLHSLAHLGGFVPDPRRVAHLCIADRHFLMRELAIRLGQYRGWHSSACRNCGERFDFQMNYAQFPVKEAADNYPFAELELSGTQCRFRLPNGEDQARLSALQSDREARYCLLRCCLQQPQNFKEDTAFFEDLSEEDITRIDQALEEMSPAVVVQVQASCPFCEHVNDIDLDPYHVLSKRPDMLLDEIHQIALFYHWSEADILKLPHRRRKHYLRLIDQARGMNQ